MIHVPYRPPTRPADRPPHRDAPDWPAQPASARGTADHARGLRPVHRAVAELRRGTAVRLAGETDLWIAAAETLSDASLAELLDQAAGPPLLLLSPVRAAALLRRPVEPDPPALALRLPGRLVLPETIRRLADPTLAQMPASDEDGLALAPVPALASAALALIKLARLLPAAIVAAAGPAGASVAAETLLSVDTADVLAYPAEHAARLRREAEASVPLEDAPDARIVAFRAPDGGVEHLAIVIGRPEDRGPAVTAPLVRLHSECFTGDFLGSLRCDCGSQLRGAIRRMAEEGDGVLLYLAQEGRGIGLVNKLRAYALQDVGLDTLDANRALGWAADERRFLVAAAMLEQLGVTRVRMLTNNPDKVEAMAACGIEVAGRESHIYAANGVNDRYLATKATRFGHLL